MRAAESAWCALAVAIVAWELTSPPDNTLTDGADRATLRHPILVRAAIITTAAHLLRILPRRVDPFTQTAQLIACSRRDRTP